MADAFQTYADVLIPGGLPEALTYGVEPGQAVERGSVVLVPMGRRKDLQLGMVAEVHNRTPSFAVKPLLIHGSAFRFPDSFVEAIEWTGRFHGGGSNRALDVFWPAELPKYLDHLAGIAPKRKQATRPDAPCTVPLPLPQATAEQEAAIARLLPMLAGKGFRGVLLHGVTGSGKTQVYVELVRACLAMGRNALILVPEIALTPQTRDRFQQHLGEQVHVLHSNLSAPAKRETWLALLGGKAHVVLGTRSAILSPGLEPALIVIDEEHDSSYKQQDPAPRYHCRDLAFHLAHRNGALVVLGSATPSLESYHNAQKGNLTLLRLTQRARPVAMPKVHIVDQRKLAPLQPREWMLSAPLRETLAETLAAGHQAIILHNRRGFSTSRICIHCGDVLQCRDCQVPVVRHRQHDGLLCHYCNRLYPVGDPCPKCGKADFTFEGGGIEKVEEEIQGWIPAARILRMDRDTVQGVGAAEKLLDSFRAKEANVLLGTQMVAKGHDFPEVQLVGIVSADIGASLPDFRGSERSFQLLTQVAGRAGRAKEGGRVILQTWNPDDKVFRFALAHDYEGFAEWELANRKELGYPPFQRMLSIELSSPKRPALEAACECIGTSLAKQAGIVALGPADAFIPVLRKQHRMHFMLKGPTPKELRHAAEASIQALPASLAKAVTVKVDLDPIGLT